MHAYDDIAGVWVESVVTPSLLIRVTAVGRDADLRAAPLTEGQLQARRDGLDLLCKQLHAPCKTCVTPWFLVNLKALDLKLITNKFKWLS